MVVTNNSGLQSRLGAVNSLQVTRPVKDPSGGEAEVSLTTKTLDVTIPLFCPQPSLSSSSVLIHPLRVLTVPFSSAEKNC